MITFEGERFAWMEELSEAKDCNMVGLGCSPGLFGSWPCGPGRPEKGGLPGIAGSIYRSKGGDGRETNDARVSITGNTLRSLTKGGD